MEKRKIYQQKFNSARSNLLLMLILTVVNIVLLVAGSDTFLLFSASIPYYAVCLPVVWGEYALFLAGCILAAVLMVLYFLCWLLSKKRPGWLVVALVLFALDTLGLVGFYVLAEEISGIMDLLIHVWVLYYLISGISCAKKLKNIPMTLEETEEAEAIEAEAASDHSVPIRRIGEDEKCRVLLEAEYGGRRIVYRRVKRTNQLVINDYIYDEIELLVEPAHSLYANLDGHTYEVGFDGAAKSYFKVDGQIVAKKMRLY